MTAFSPEQRHITGSPRASWKGGEPRFVVLLPTNPVLVAKKLAGFPGDLVLRQRPLISGQSEPPRLDDELVEVLAGLGVTRLSIEFPVESVAPLWRIRGLQSLQLANPVDATLPEGSDLLHLFSFGAVHGADASRARVMTMGAGSRALSGVTFPSTLEDLSVTVTGAGTWHCGALAMAPGLQHLALTGGVSGVEVSRELTALKRLAWGKIRAASTDLRRCHAQQLIIVDTRFTHRTLTLPTGCRHLILGDCGTIDVSRIEFNDALELVDFHGSSVPTRGLVRHLMDRGIPIYSDRRIPKLSPDEAAWVEASRGMKPPVWFDAVYGMMALPRTWPMSEDLEYLVN